MSAAFKNTNGDVLYMPLKTDSEGRQAIAKAESAGNISVVANGSAAPVLFASQECDKLTVVNNSGADVEFQQDGVGTYFTVKNGAQFAIVGITNTNQIGFRRVDLAATATTVQARWEKNV